MNSKKLITLLVLATLIFAMVPFAPVARAELDVGAITVDNDDTDAVEDAEGEYKHLIIVLGDEDLVASGYEVLIYWDIIKDWDGKAGHLNTTDADSDGSFEIWFEVPEAEYGEHDLWITATDQSTKVRVTFDVMADCDLDSSSGLAGDRVYVDFYGFDNNEDIGILFVVDPIMDNWNTDTETLEDLDEEGDGSETDFDGQVSNGMIKPGTFNIMVYNATEVEYRECAIDDGHHKLIDNNATDKYTVDDGSIDYVTGEWSIEFTSANTLENGDVMYVTHEYFDDLADDTYVLASNGETDTVGSWKNRRITIPDDADEDVYYVYGFDGDNHTAADDFTIGAVITLETDAAAVGEVVEIEGEGFDDDTPFRVYIVKGTTYELECHVIDAEDEANKTDGTGEFRVEVIIPQTDDADDDYEIEVRCGPDTVSEDFEVTDLAEIAVEPNFGPQGSKMTVSGVNFPQIDSEVNIELWEDDGSAMVVEIEDEVEVDSDGTFEIQVRVPTETDGQYKIKAYVVSDDDGHFNIDDSTNFRIGTMLVLLSEDSGVTGEKIILTGSGFTEDGDWNATFGDVVIFEDVEADSDGILKEGGDTPAFLVPQLEPGTYTITVWDIDEEINVDVDFEVTDNVYLEFSSYSAPNGYNVSMNGWYWPEVDGEENTVDDIDWVLYNDTDDWDMNVRQLGAPGVIATLNETGGLVDAWWMVPSEDDLDKGTYYVNASIETTSDLFYIVQFEFTIGDVHALIQPRKATFRIGDTVSFKVQHSFGGQAGDIDQSKIKVYDPDDSLYWLVDEYDVDDWTQVEMWWELPYSEQTDGGNPMIILDDAPLGTWSYEWLDEAGDEIDSGTFQVAAAAEEVISEQIEDLNSAIDDLTSDISAVTDAVAGVQSNVNSAIQAANAAVDAANAAVQAVNAGAALSGEALEAADRAAEAAGKAQDAATGLTTLVYGAIGASLVAALAAIVSLMQISRRIAG